MSESDGAVQCRGDGDGGEVQEVFRPISAGEYKLFGPHQLSLLRE